MFYTRTLYGRVEAATLKFEAFDDPAGEHIKFRDEKITYALLFTNPPRFPVVNAPDPVVSTALPVIYTIDDFFLCITRAG